MRFSEGILVVGCALELSGHRGTISVVPVLNLSLKYHSAYQRHMQ